MVLAVWLGVTYTNTCFMKWSWNTKMLATLGDLFSSKVVSMLIKSTCKRSRGAVAMIGCRGALDKLPSCSKQHAQVLMDCCIWLVIPSHQKHSCNRDRVQSWPWCSASLWHLFRAVTQCTFGTMKSRRSSFSPLGIEHRYRGFSDELWSSVYFARSVGPPYCRHALLKVSSDQSSFGLPTSLKLCSALDLLWASAQSVTCIWTNMYPVVTQTFRSKSWSPLNYGGVIHFHPMGSP